ncbi:hypothetical protein [Frigoriglobus tundricola]|nr:hypothetical protein [Frigoriglobus tundricola]
MMLSPVMLVAMSRIILDRVDKEGKIKGAVAKKAGSTLMWWLFRGL